MRVESKIFTVIVGDLVHSRNISGRQKISHKIRLVIDSISKKFQKEFYAPFVLTRGIDELSGVLKQCNMSYRICRLLNEGVYPYLFRFAIVRGTLDVDITSKDARRIDGPAFHIAADMIQQAKKENQYYCFNLGSQFQDYNLVLNGVTNFLHLMQSRWTNHQRLVVQLYKRFEKQKAVAKELGITQQAVSDALRQARWKELEQLETIIDQILKEYCSNKQNGLCLTKQAK